MLTEKVRNELITSYKKSSSIISNSLKSILRRINAKMNK